MSISQYFRTRVFPYLNTETAQFTIQEYVYPYHTHIFPVTYLCIPVIAFFSIAAFPHSGIS